MKRSFPTLLAAALLAVTALPLPADPPHPPATTDLGRGPAFVVIHDLGDSRLTWMPTVRQLMGHHRVVLADLPGHGDTPLPDPFSLDAAAAALDPLLATLPPENTILVGKGVGGYVAMLAAAAHPERVRGLVLVDVALKAPLQVADQQMKMFTQWMDEHYEDFLSLTLGSAGRDSAENVAIRARAAQVPSLTMKSYTRALLTADARRAARGARLPMLLVLTGRTLHGGDVTAATKELGWERIAVNTRTLPGAGYLVMQQRADSLAAVLETFQAQVTAPH